MQDRLNLILPNLSFSLPALAAPVGKADIPAFAKHLLAEHVAANGAGASRVAKKSSSAAREDKPA